MILASNLNSFVSTLIKLNSNIMNKFLMLLVIAAFSATIVGCNQPAAFDQATFDSTVDSTFNAKLILLKDEMNKACNERMKLEMPEKLDSTLTALKLK